METELASALFDEQRIVFAKAWAYELNVPQHEAVDRLEAFFSANLEKLDSTWITMQNDCMMLTKQREHASSKLFSIQKKSTLDSTVLGLEIEHNRRELVQNDPKERLLHNTLGSVKFDDLKVSGSKTLISFKSAAPVPASVAPAKPATTAASFFKKEVEPEKKPTMTPIERKAAAAAAAAAAPKPVELKKSPVVVSSSSEASSSGEEEEEEELGAAASATKPPPAAKRKAPTKPEAAAKKKKSKVVLSDDDEDDDDEAKAKAKQEKKEAKRLKREEEKLAQKEEKKRHEIELANEAKVDFLRHQLGAAPASAPASSNNKVKKRVLKTKTFIDEDGFEVTEDVFEEIEVDEPVVPASVTAAAPAPVALTKTPSLTKTSKSKPQPSGKQVQLTSFFTKKTKE